jgi:predicted DNA-binding transcriptional regulator AlpA
VSASLQNQALEAVRTAAKAAASAGELPAFLGELERLRVEAITGLASPTNGSRVLTVEETAARLGRSVSWVYKNKATLPMVRFPTGGFGFDERRLERWIEGRTR